jgi:hypothetical protein
LRNNTQFSGYAVDFRQFLGADVAIRRGYSVQ